MVTVDLRDVRVALASVLDAVERENGGSILEVDRDHYWALPVESAFDMTHSSPELTVGQLSDDIDEIGRLIGREPSELFPWHDLAHLVGLLRWLELKSLP